MPVGYLYEGLGRALAAPGFGDAEQTRYAGKPAHADRVRLERAFRSVGEPSTRELILQLVALLGRPQPDKDEIANDR